MTNDITYQQLISALSHLDFKSEIKGSITIYKNVARDAIILMPTKESEGFVPQQYITAARETVNGKGIANKQDFDQLLLSPATTKPQARKIIFKTDRQRSWTTSDTKLAHKASYRLHSQHQVAAMTLRNKKKLPKKPIQS